MARRAAGDFLIVLVIAFTIYLTVIMTRRISAVVLKDSYKEIFRYELIICGVLAFLNDEACPDHRVDEGGYRPVIDLNFIHHPSDFPASFRHVAVEVREQALSGFGARIPVIGAVPCGDNGMGHAVDQLSVLLQQPENIPHEFVKVLNVVKDQGTGDQIELPVQSADILHGHPPVGDTVSAVVFPRVSEHLFRDVDAQDGRGAHIRILFRVVPHAAAIILNTIVTKVTKDRKGV